LEDETHTELWFRKKALERQPFVWPRIRWEDTKMYLDKMGFCDGRCMELGQDCVQ
jgi:hypothetical protein